MIGNRNSMSKGSFSSALRSGIVLSSMLLALGLPATASAEGAQVTVDLTDVRQRIDGFGASSAFFGVEVPDEDAEFLFSKETGIGLSLLRVRIGLAPKDPNTGNIIGEQEPQTEELETARQAFSWARESGPHRGRPPPSGRRTESSGLGRRPCSAALKGG